MQNNDISTIKQNKIRNDVSTFLTSEIQTYIFISCPT